MPQLEPTVIERMALAHKAAPIGTSSPIERMLAAVKELQKIARDDPGGRTREVAWIDGIIADHESRYQGDGEPDLIRRMSDALVVSFESPSAALLFDSVLTVNEQAKLWREVKDVAGLRAKVTTEQIGHVLDHRLISKVEEK